MCEYSLFGYKNDDDHSHPKLCSNFSIWLPELGALWWHLNWFHPIRPHQKLCLERYIAYYSAQEDECNNSTNDVGGISNAMPFSSTSKPYCRISGSVLPPGVRLLRICSAIVPRRNSKDYLWDLKELWWHEHLNVFVAYLSVLQHDYICSLTFNVYIQHTKNVPTDSVAREWRHRMEKKIVLALMNKTCLEHEAWLCPPSYENHELKNKRISK